MRRYWAAILPAFISVGLFGVTVFWFVLPSFEASIVAEKQTMIQELTRTAWSILEGYQEKVAEGRLSLSKAQAMAKSDLRHLRYGPQRKGYFWINDLTPKLLMHPFRPSLEGVHADDIQDPQEREALKRVAEQARLAGEGFVVYRWQFKDISDRQSPKLSYVMTFRPWGWVVGTGIYLDDMESGMAAMRRALSLVGLGVLALVSIIAGWMTLRRMRAESQRREARAALQETLEKHRAVLEASPDPIVVYDQVGRADYVNPAFTRVFGWAAEEVLDRRIDFVPPAEMERTKAAIQEVYQTPQGAVSFDSRRYTKDGRILDIRISAAIYRDPDGTPVGMVVNLTDLTERHEVEEALRESEERFRSICDYALDAIFMADHAGHFVFLNPAAETILEAADGHLLDQPVASVLDQDDYRQAAARAGRDSQRGGVIETTARLPGGRLLPVELSLTWLTLENRPHTLGIFRDISARKRAEEALRASEEKYRLLVENQTDLVVKLDPEGRFLFVSPSYCQLFGKSEAELLGQSFLPMVHLEDRQATSAAMEGLGSPPHSVIVEHRALCHEGRRWLAWSLSAVLDPQGEVTAVVGVGRDITQRKEDESERAKLEAQLQHAQKMEAVGTLASGIAHDFNNILQGISGYVALLSSHAAPNSTDRAHLVEIEGAVQRASDLVRRLLTFGRKVEPNLAPLDLNRQVGQAVAMLERLIPKMISITTDLAPDLPPAAADAGQLEQVILNLGANAVDAMPEGGTMSLATEHRSLGPGQARAAGLEPGDYLVFSLADTGEGMAPEVRRHIFDPFYTTKETGKGTGLGLAIAYGILRNHGGAITCYSEPGQGTIFHLYLPVAQGAAAAVGGAEEAPDEVQGGDETILLVDDEETIIAVAREILSQFGYRVLSASSGEEALEIYGARGDEVDMVVLDLGMPGIGGVKTLKALKVLDAGVKVLVASGYSADNRVAETLNEGAMGFLRKPYRFTDLLGSIRQVLDGEAAPTRAAG